MPKMSNFYCHPGKAQGGLLTAPAIEALTKVQDLPVRQVIAGKGEMKKQCEGLAEKLGVGDLVEFLGEIPYKQTPALYLLSDAFIFASIRDSFGSQVLEAMASGLPIIALDHQRVRIFVPDGAGVKVPVTIPRETIDSLIEPSALLHARPKWGTSWDKRDGSSVGPKRGHDVHK